MTSPGKVIDIEALMREIRSEIGARVPVGRETTEAQPEWLARSDTPPGGAHVHLGRLGEFSDPLPKKSSYDLNDFLAYHDEDFVRNAYRALLRREPDAEGASRFLVKMRSGELSRIEVLGRLRFSPEGRVAGVPVKGLLLPFGMRTARRVPLLGRVLGILQYAWRLPDIARHHETLESAVFANRAEMRRLINARLSEIEATFERMRQRQSEEASRSSSLHETLRRAQDADMRKLSGQFEGFATQLAEKADQIDVEKLRQALEASMNRIQAEATEAGRALDARVSRVARDLDLVRDASQDLAQRYARSSAAERIVKAMPGPMQEPPGPAHASTYEGDASTFISDAFYVDFEERFRGTRHEIKQRVRVYLPLIKEANAGNPERPILDIGCGRGEWLEVLQEHDLVASGVDVNRVLVAGSRARGLDVREADAIEYMRTLPADSRGAVSAIHLIEHLPFARIVALFDEALRVLKPGGIAIFETPNPENLIVGACSFYYDPTHHRPLPPAPTQFLLESRGFTSVEIMPLHPDANAPDAGTVTGGASGAIWQRLFGPRDYALVGFKP
jgi:O-antigen chain-terminating methyltransferase